ncbi:MAG: hypothetical protein IJ597_01075 [Synergistaceae bacterium]|nr:hypothetical protein [Synergistaceae bacterium]
MKKFFAVMFLILIFASGACGENEINASSSLIKTRDTRIKARIYEPIIFTALISLIVWFTLIFTLLVFMKTENTSITLEDVQKLIEENNAKLKLNSERIN